VFQDLVSDIGWKIYEKRGDSLGGSCSRGDGGGATGGGVDPGLGFGGTSFSPNGGGTIGGEFLSYSFLDSLFQI